MASSASSPTLGAQFEDVLAHLPATNATRYPKGQAIYSPDKPSNSIYLVVSGTVGVSQIAADGSEVLLEIFRPDELFGESAFGAASRSSERATTLEHATLMAWAVSEMESLVIKRPRLAMALLQILAQRNADLTRRVESFSTDHVERRLARSLLRLSERLGAPEADGAVRMMPLSHEMLSRYVGTSREVVTQFMNGFRKRGYVSYSRNCIRLTPDALKAWVS